MRANKKRVRGTIDTNIKIENKMYNVLGSYVKSHKMHQKEQEYTTILYFIDETYLKKARARAKRFRYLHWYYYDRQL